MRRILYIGNNLKESNPTTLRQLSKILTEVSFEVTIYSTKKNRFLRLLAMCFGVLKHRNFDYLLLDSYSTYNFYYALIVSQLARLFSMRYIPILHGGNLPNRLIHNPWFSNLLFKSAYINVAPSNYLLNEFKQNGFRTIFIPNAIDTRNYEFKKRTKVQPKLLWVRAFDEIYNPLMAIKVLSLLKEKYPSASLCMIGPDKDGSMKDVKEKATQLGILDAIEITGLLSKEAWTDKSKDFDVFINTTTIDNIPVSVIEAMALGLPVVSTNVGGMPYLIDSYKNGILVADNDAKQMVIAIEELLKNPSLVNEITNEAKERVKDFDIEMVKQQWNNLLI